MLLLPPTVAVNCCVFDADRLTEAGLVVTDTVGLRVMVELEDLVVSATLVAVIVTVWVVLMLDGAV